MIHVMRTVTRYLWIALPSCGALQLSAQTTPDTIQGRAVQPARVILFEDDFNQAGRLPDTTKWELCPRRSPHWARYLSESYEQAYVEDGKLVLLAEQTPSGYRVGGVHTKGRFSFQYGRVEVCARFTKQAQGAWPAIWMMPAKPRYPDAPWPTTGEIDIMEQLNRDSIVYQTIHSHYHNGLKRESPRKTATAPYSPDTYNIYSLDWTPDYLSLGVNGVEHLRYPNLHLTEEETLRQWPFDAPFYLILNIALGGEGTWPGVIHDAELPAKMEVDWVRISRPASPASTAPSVGELEGNAYLCSDNH